MASTWRRYGTDVQGAAFEKYLGVRYTQHSTGVADGAQGFLEFFEPFLARNPKREMEIVRILEDGYYVFVHCRQSLNGGAARWVTTDLFDTDEDGRIIEHPILTQHPAGLSNSDLSLRRECDARRDPRRCSGRPELVEGRKRPAAKSEGTSPPAEARSAEA